ncbi:MAG: beta-glucosidase, partial [Micromonosporaceae bacterium]|nr:beta-glucosidase [Micromonosporaceae bacterium]
MSGTRILSWRGKRTAGVVAAVLIASTLSVSQPAYAAAVNLAPFGLASATSAENAGLGADKAIDGDPATRWSSLFADPQSLTVDLGAQARVSGVTMMWEAAFASAYSVETSIDGTTWTPAFSTTTGDGGTDEVTGLDVAARYVRLTGTARATAFGYSLFEFAVLGEFTQQAVSLGAATATLGEKGTVTVPVRLNKPADHDVTVHYATADGSAVAGSDYVAASGTLTFPAGTTEQTVTLTGVDDGIHENAESFDLALSAATPADTIVGPRATLSVSIADDDPLPFDGRTVAVDDFQAGVPAGLTAFGGDAASTPTLAAVAAADRPGAAADNQAMRVTYAVTSFGGFSRNLPTAQDWSSYDGFSFWVNGTGSGQTVQFEIKDGGADADHSELWESTFVDSFAGWRKVQVPFPKFKLRTSFQPAGAP